MDDMNFNPNWRVIVDALADPAVVIDQAGTVIHLNPLVADLFPRVRAGFPVALLSREPALLDALQEAGRNELPMVVQLHDRVPIERKLSAIITALSVEEIDDRSPAFLIVLRDVTDQERHAQLRADFVANASHELRTPLASLKLTLETLLGAGRDDAEAKQKFLGMMSAQADRMIRLIDDLMSLNRVEMRAHLAPRASVDVGDLLTQTVATLTPLAQSNDITLSLTPPGKPVHVRGDHTELSQVFDNLVQNGIRYGRVGSRVSISVEYPVDVGGQPLVGIAVADTGIGIAAEHLPRLTERFFRVSAAASRQKGGTGLGLAIVKHIVSRHRGELRIESEPGKGSVFTVLLPIAAN
ncbi:MAG: two-component sensor histidine kinase [Hyphomicrobiaceae bacterium]